MPITSYIAHPILGRKDELVQQLESEACCTVYPSDNTDLVILVTDTATFCEEQELQQKLKTKDSIACLSMTYCHDEEEHRVASS